jgi:uncharacterized protein YodC (DUF2158 family)
LPIFLKLVWQSKEKAEPRRRSQTKRKPTMAMAQKFKAGDIVRLKSGGPDMTVSGYQETLDDLFDDSVPPEPASYTRNVICRWFTLDDKHRRYMQNRGSFHEDMLVLVGS